MERLAWIARRFCTEPCHCNAATYYACFVPLTCALLCAVGYLVLCGTGALLSWLAWQAGLIARALALCPSGDFWSCIVPGILGFVVLGFLCLVLWILAVGPLTQLRDRWGAVCAAYEAERATEPVPSYGTV